jgi:hypothetical protein
VLPVPRMPELHTHTYTGYIHEELYDDENLLLVGHRFKKLSALMEKERCV